jgi:phage protein D/phage baseplate assembly protein gpV
MSNSSSPQAASNIYVKVNGQDLPPEQLRAISSITVEQNLYLPDTCTVMLRDATSTQDPQAVSHFALADQNVLPIGADIEIGMGRNQAAQKVFDGEVTGNDLDVAFGEAPRFVIRGYDRAHRLLRGRQSRSFLNVTDSDIANKIASESGLRPDVTGTSQVYPYILQNNQTNLEFLQERASRIGFEVYVEGSTLHFGKPRVNDGVAQDLQLWQDMLRAHVRLTSTGQVKKVTVRGWDPSSKQPILGQASNGTVMAQLGKPQTPADLAKPFGDATMVVTRQPVQNQGEADQLAQALADDLAGSAVQLEAEVRGNPALQPGLVVNLTTFGDRFSGQYYITSARHHNAAGHPYTTVITVSGRRSGSLLELVRGMGQAQGHGVGDTIAIGVVTDNKDDKGLGRVKVKLPWLADDATDWARVVIPGGGSARGFYWLPEVNDEVLVAFEQGDARRPYVIGGLWNGTDKPPKGNSDVVDGSGAVTQRIIKSRSGHTITLDDTSGSGKISVVDSSGNNMITIDTSNNKITLSAQGDLELKAGGNVSVQAQGDCKINASGNINASATGNCDIKATGNCDIEATGNAKMSGAQISVEAQATCAVKGAMVTLN